MKKLIVLLMSINIATPSFAGDENWKLLFNRLFALEIYKEKIIGGENGWYGDEKDFNEALARHTSYTPLTFNESLNQVLDASSSIEAYELRKTIFADPKNRILISSLKFDDIFSAEQLSSPRLSSYLASIEKHKARSIKSDELFLASPEGQEMIKSLTTSEGEKKNFAFVMIPGYAAHVIKDYIFEEFVNDVNSYHGRCKNRPVLKEDGIDFTFLDYKSYYGSQSQSYCPDEILENHHPTNEAFVYVLHPSGWELGNTIGDDRETVRLIRRWLRELPSKYENSDIVLLGYSKGASVVLDILRQIKASAANANSSGYPIIDEDLELVNRIKGFVTYGGVVQGTNVARSAKAEIESTLKDRSIEEYIEEIKNESIESIMAHISPFFSGLDFSFLSQSVLEKVYDIFGLEYQSTHDLVDRLVEGRELKELLEGADDLSPIKRTLWNLKNFNNKTFSEDVFVMNLSGVTDISMFSRPNGYAENPADFKSSLHPKLKLDSDGEVEIDFSNFSLDTTFLYLSSIEGFKTAPAGLFDTQVELPNTKSMLLDTRTLKESLTPEELQTVKKTIEQQKADFEGQMIDEVFIGKNVDEEVLFSTPRRDLFKRNAVNNITSIDLGEFRGHHWSLFTQALKPPAQISKDYAFRDFPRKAFMRALLQVIATYRIVNEDKALIGGQP